MSGANFKLPEINMSSNVTPHTKLYSVLCCTIKLKFSSHPRQQCVLKWLYFTRGKMLSIMKILFLLKHRDFTKCPNNWSETKIFCLFQAKNWWEKWWSQSWKSFPFSTFWLGVSFVYLQEFDWQISRFLSLCVKSKDFFLLLTIFKNKNSSKWQVSRVFFLFFRK